ncbi:MAG: hypothetical protein HDS50_04885 [Bacteroides sp.]|nr:hypothetical protein [Bacteroides sp.]
MPKTPAWSSCPGGGNSHGAVPQTPHQQPLSPLSCHDGLTLSGDNFKTGSILITRQSVKGVIGHTLNIAVRDSLLGIEKNALNYRYIGWGECKTDTQTGKPKHPEAAFFLYYEVEIAGKTYYANVKANKSYLSEELYCIRDRCNIAALNHGAPPTVDEW